MVKRYSKTQKTDLRIHAGKWVAFVNQKVVESAPSLDNLMSKVQNRKFKSQPSVMLVPRKDEGPYVLFL